MYYDLSETYKKNQEIEILLIDEKYKAEHPMQGLGLVKFHGSLIYETEARIPAPAHYTGLIKKDFADKMKSLYPEFDSMGINQYVEEKKHKLRSRVEIYQTSSGKYLFFRKDEFELRKTSQLVQYKRLISETRSRDELIRVAMRNLTSMELHEFLKLIVDNYRYIK